MDYHYLLNMATRVGSCLLENGAEIYRVEESIERIIAAYGIDDVNVFAVPSAIIVTLVTPEGISITKNKRIHSRSINLDKVSQLNQLCRSICQCPIPLDEIQGELDAIKARPTFEFTLQAFAYGLIAFSFTLFYGGRLPDALCGFVIGWIIKCTTHTMIKVNSNTFFTNIIASGLIATLAIIAVKIGVGQNLDEMIIGTLMNLVPGVAMTNSIRDIIAGDFMAGQTKLIEALLTGVAMALGAGIALSAAQLL